MQSRLVLKSLLGLLWLLIITNLVATLLLSPSLPHEQIVYVTHNPMQLYSQMIYGLFLATTLFASICLLRNQLIPAQWALATSCFAYLGIYAVLGYGSIAISIGSLHELVALALGMTLTYALCSPLNKNPISYLNIARLTYCALIIATILLIAVTACIEKHVPAFAMNFDKLNQIQPKISDIAAGIMLCSLVLLFFNSKIAKYLFILTNLVIILDGFAIPSFSPAVSLVADHLLLMVMGSNFIFITYSLFREKQAWISKDNPIRSLLLSIVSPKFYREVVTEKKGRGIFLLAFLFCVWGGVLSYQTIKHDPFQPIIAAIKKSDQALPQLNAPRSKPYILNDEQENPIFIIDYSGQYKSMNDTLGSTILLFTKDKVEFKKNNGYAVITVHFKTRNLNKKLLVARLEGMIVGKAIPSFFFGSIILLAICLYIIFVRTFFITKRVEDKKARMRLAIFSIYPVLMLIIGLEIFNINVFDSGLLAIGMILLARIYSYIAENAI